MKASSKRLAAGAPVLLAAAVHGGDARGAEGGDPPQYQVVKLPSLGGTISRGNSVNDRGWVSGYSNLAGNQTRHATLWIDGEKTDLHTLGGPNSNVAWPVKNTSGRLSGISQ